MRAADVHAIALFVREHRLRTAETLQARVTQYIDGIRYKCVLDETGGTLEATLGQPGITLQVGQHVVLNRTDASGRTQNTGWSIVVYPPSGQLNGSVSSPLTLLDSRAGISVSKLAPESVVLVRGGATVTLTISGTGFNRGPKYGHAGITDVVLPTVNASPTIAQIIAQVHAAADVPVGEYSLTLSNTTFVSSSDGGPTAPPLTPAMGSVITIPAFFSVI